MGGTIIRTIKQNCRRCYTCVRDCPAKAIRIEDGQAFVVDERCIVNAMVALQKLGLIS